jgi:hypothetical protein
LQEFVDGKIASTVGITSTLDGTLEGDAIHDELAWGTQIDPGVVLVGFATDVEHAGVGTLEGYTVEDDVGKELHGVDGANVAAPGAEYVTSAASTDLHVFARFCTLYNSRGFLHVVEFSSSFFELCFLK